MSEWKEYKLGELIANGHAELQTGPFGTMLNASEYVLEGTPVIAVQDIGENKLVYHKFVFVDENTAQRLSRYRVKENDIIFGRKGAVERRALIKKHEEGWLQGSNESVSLQGLPEGVYLLRFPETSCAAARVVVQR